MSRVRNPFRRQDSFTATAAVPALSSQPTAAGENVEMTALDGGEEVDHKDKLSDRDVLAQEEKNEDPAMLDLRDLDDKDKLANGKERPIETSLDMSTRLLSTADDPTAPVHTFRLYVLGLGMTAFAGCLGQIFYFRPTSLSVSSLFIVVVSHILGTAWSWLLPNASRGSFWRFLNPCPFSLKEHVGILIMSSTAFSSASAIGVFAADELYYDIYPNYGQAIFVLIASQFAGYGLAGMCRSFLVFPTFAVWPSLFPTVQLFDLLHRDTDVAAQKKRFYFFLSVAGGIFVWSFFPEFIAPTLTGISIVCLARRDSAWVTRIFGGAYPNEGMGLFQLCFDWVYISGCSSLYTPLQSQFSLYAGTALCIIVTCVMYAKNVWNAQNFPFLAQDLFYENGTSYDQMSILNADYSLNETLLAEQGVPWLTPSYGLFYLGCNLAIGATIMHIALWHGDAIVKAVRSFRLRSTDDPHYRKMLVYKEVPMWVYGAILLGSFVIAMATSYTGDSHLPWYGVIAAFLIAIVLFPFLCLFPAVTGWQVDGSNLVLMLGSAVIPGNSQANMFFSLFGSTASTQGIAFASDLKMAQYIKLPPRTTLFLQSLGTVVGGIIQIALAKQLLKQKRDILLDPQGTNLWSGQNVQTVNAQAVTWGALAKHMYSPSSTYAIIPFAVLIGFAVPVPFYILHRLYPKLRANLVITPLICYGLGYLNAGINSQNFMAIITAVLSQWYLRKYRSTWFRKYNYILSAALDAGIQIYVFITTFALAGGNGHTQTMPNWALNPEGYPDYCYAGDA
ncbi:hypothetical protein JCM6882_008892 [Rhodosporidiobolus microsporus]